MKLAELPVAAPLRNMRHRTPRYVYNRTRQMLYEHGHPGEPWVTPESARLLASMLRQSDQGLEFGSGRSTIWFAQRVRHLTSVEHDKRWYDTVARQIRDRELANVEYILAPRVQPDDLGATSEYARTALRFDDVSLDFVLVDGLYREHITRLVLPKIKPGGLLIIDNVNWFLPSRSRSPSSRTLALGPDGEVWTGIAQILATWRSIWTSSGVWDTAMFVKPE